MTNLNGLCGQTHEGRLVSTDSADADFAGKKLIMGPVACAGNEIAIPFAVGDNRSRTWLITRTGNVPEGFDASVITLAGIVHNLVPVTLGNIVGGAALVGAVYWTIYRATFGTGSAGEPP